MSAPTGKVAKWTQVQAYGFCCACLVLGMLAGYLMHAPSHAVAAASATPQQAAVQQAASAPSITPAQLKHVADKEAEPLLAQLKARPNDAALLTQIGQAYFQGRQLAAAAEYYERAAKVKPDAEILTSLGAIYHYAGDDNRAIECMSRALKVNPTFDGALFNLGMLKWKHQADPEGAVRMWEKLLKAYPNHPRRAELESLIVRAREHMNMTAKQSAASSD